MDSLTQATLGAAIGELLLGKRLGNRALGWGALFGTLPDLDVVLMPLLGTANDLIWHRGPSHSLLVMILASYFLSPWLARRWRHEKISRARAGWFIFGAWSTHVLIDCFTVYGTSVWWPFPAERVALNHLFIIDFMFTMPMLVALVWAACLRNKKQLAKRRRLNAWGLGFASAYALLSVGMKMVASAGFDADLAGRGVEWKRRMEAPTPFNILLWRSVVDRGDEFWVGYRSVFEPRSQPVRWTVFSKGADAVAGQEGTRDMRTIEWFTGGWWIARPHSEGAWIGDLRFGESREWGAKKNTVDHRLAFAWNLCPSAEGETLRQLHPARVAPGEMLRRLVVRAFGGRQAWDGDPRLAGVTGSLPEFLNVVE